jgi:hypothetical protein
MTRGSPVRRMRRSSGAWLVRAEAVITASTRRRENRLKVRSSRPLSSIDPAGPHPAGADPADHHRGLLRSSVHVLADGQGDAISRGHRGVLEGPGRWEGDVRRGDPDDRAVKLTDGLDLGVGPVLA